MVRRIFHLGEDELRKASEPVTTFDDELRTLVRDMFETMYKNNGVGLAAPQVGVNKRLFVIDTGDNPLTFINPEILEAAGKETCNEGCLSLPGLQETVTRAKWIKARAMDLDGNTFEIEADGLLARAVQHENDHLDGVLFIDRISKARRLQIRHELEIIEAGGRIEYEDDDDDSDNGVDAA
ncbi:MAG TPA: peptide deformylase [Candidatus Ozemobacteraceae bacterium]|nr:peptide deformylase [Candidatus Ozemobacteraceae bacterium]